MFAATALLAANLKMKVSSGGSNQEREVFG
jgi:hypothetical protein